MRSQDRLSKILVALWLLSFGGCASAPEPSGPLLREGDLEGLVEEALAKTMPAGPVQITFDFRLRESDLRFSGRGVARVQPPYRVRIDLFSNRGEELFRAALVGSDLRVPPGVPLDLAPPPALLWAALGVFRPDEELRIVEGRGRVPQAVTLRYSGARGEDFRFRLVEGRLVRAEMLEGGSLIEEVDLELSPDAENVVETTYRNHPLFLELVFSLESVESVDSFPAHIWYPGG